MGEDQPGIRVKLTLRQAQNEASWKALWDWLLAPGGEPSGPGYVNQGTAGDTEAHEPEVAHGISEGPA
jgi:hypothetical protein